MRCDAFQRASGADEAGGGFDAPARCGAEAVPAVVEQADDAADGAVDSGMRGLLQVGLIDAHDRYALEIARQHGEPVRAGVALAQAADGAPGERAVEGHRQAQRAQAFGGEAGGLGGADLGRERGRRADLGAAAAISSRSTSSRQAWVTDRPWAILVSLPTMAPTTMCACPPHRGGGRRP